MEIISCFEPKRAAYAPCGAATIEDLLNSHRLERRGFIASYKDVRIFLLHAADVLKHTCTFIVYMRFVIAAVLLLLCCAFCVLQLMHYAYFYASPLILADSDSAAPLILDGSMRNFALNSGSEEFDGNGNISLPDSAAAASVAMPVTYSQYTVKPGDSISSITKRFALSNISTLIAANNIENVRLLRAGQTLRIPSIDGLAYTVKDGDSLTELAHRYAVTVEELLDVNELSSDVLLSGSTLFIPGIRLDSAALKKVLGELFAAPLGVKWRVSSAFGWRPDPFTGVRSFHTGIDLVVPYGTPILSAMGGRISALRYSNIYGNHVIIDHGNGYQTLYAHLSAFSVKKGAYVQQGERIGYVGNTGYSTGTHLHFSVYKNGTLINPAKVLRF